MTTDATWTRSRLGFTEAEIKFQDELLPELLKYVQKNEAEYLAVVASTRASSIFGQEPR